MHPIQQQGRRLPFLSSETTRLTCSSLVFCCLTVIVQQIHSFRANGVRLCQANSAGGEEVRAFFRSAGILCDGPLFCSSLIIGLLYQVYLCASLHIDALMQVCYAEFVTKGVQMRTTITINDKIYRALRIRAAESGETVSALVEDAVKEQVLEDLDDLRTVKERENEPAIDFKVFVKDLKADGLI